MKKGKNSLFFFGVVISFLLWLYRMTIDQTWLTDFTQLLFILLSKIFYFRFASSCIQIAYLSVATVVRRNHWQKKNVNFEVDFYSFYPRFREWDETKVGQVGDCDCADDEQMA